MNISKIRKPFYLAILMLFSTAYISAQKVAELPEIKNPYPLLVNNNELVFADDFSIYVYTIDPFNLKYKLGKMVMDLLILNTP